jgi:hypothetical protein
MNCDGAVVVVGVVVIDDKGFSLLLLDTASVLVILMM